MDRRRVPPAASELDLRRIAAYTPWEGDGPFLVDDLDQVLAHAAGQGASDIVFRAGAPITAEVAGQSFRATSTGERLGAIVMGELGERLYGPSVNAQLSAGRDLNCSYAVRAAGQRVRFRVNITPVLVDWILTTNVVMRVLPRGVPDLAEQQLDGGLEEALLACRGVSIVTGVPGSGKSTLLAGVIGRIAERGVGRIQTYESPIEYTYEALGAGETISQTEIPTHLESFQVGVRASLRRSPAAVLVGEARERATVEAVIDAADFGIATYTTTHAAGVSNTVRRLLGEFDERERDGRALALLERLTVIVTQALAADPRGGRTAVREWLVFDEDVRQALARLAPQEWSRWLEDRVRADGRLLQQQAHSAWQDGHITEAAARRLGATGRSP